MADSDVKTQVQARSRIGVDVPDFLKTYRYEKDLGVFHEKWPIYRDLDLSRFREAAPEEDRMVLPGMEVALDVVNIAIQTFGGVWEELLKGSAVYGGRKLYRLARKRALECGATRDLAGQLADFFTKRFERQGSER